MLALVYAGEVAVRRDHPDVLEAAAVHPVVSLPEMYLFFPCSSNFFDKLVIGFKALPLNG